MVDPSRTDHQAYSWQLTLTDICWHRLVLGVLLAPAFGGFLYGYDIGVTAFVLQMLVDSSTTVSSVAPPYPSNVEEMEMIDRDRFMSPVVVFWWHDFAQQPTKQGLLMGAVSAGALMGSHIILFYLSSRRISRKRELQGMAFLYVLGMSFCILSGTVWATTARSGWYALFLGKFIFGIGVGLLMHAAPAYMAEMAPSAMRGAVVSAKEAIIVSGIVTGYAVGNWAATRAPGHGCWVLPYIVTCFVSVPLVILTLHMPRSVRWLLMHGYEQEAAASFRYVYRSEGRERVQADFHELCRTVTAIEEKPHQPFQDDKESTNASDTSIGALFRSPNLRVPLMTAIGLVIAQQLSGQPSILGYAAVLLATAGYQAHVSVMTAIVMLAVSTTTVFLVDHVGRKRLLQIGCMVLAGSLLTLAITWTASADLTTNASSDITAHTTDSIVISSILSRSIILLAMFTYIGGYQIGFGPITWLIVSEIFPGPARGIATALCVELNYFLNFLVQLLVPILYSHVGWGLTFALFGMNMVLAWCFINVHIPETKGLMLEEIGCPVLQEQEQVPVNQAISMQPTLRPSKLPIQGADSSSLRSVREVDNVNHCGLADIRNAEDVSLLGGLIDLRNRYGLENVNLNDGAV